MSKISINTTTGGRGFERPSIENLNPGETFRFRFGRGDQVYMKVADDRAQDVNYEDEILNGGYDWSGPRCADAFYASLGSGQIYRARPNADIVRVRVEATVERA